MARRPFTPEDIRRQVVLEEHDLSTDGRLAVVGRRVVRGNRYVAHLWAVPIDDGHGRRATQLTSGLVLDRAPRLSPDGRTVAFVRHTHDDHDRSGAAWLMPVTGGRPSRPQSGSHGAIDTVAWSPDGSRLAYTAEVDPPRFIVGQRAPLGGAAAHAGRRAPDEGPVARRITRTDWRYDGSGHLDHWSHLFVVEIRRGAVPRQVTHGEWGVAGITWSPDGRTVAFTSDRGPEADLRPRTTIWAVDVDAPDAEPREVLAPAGSASRPVYSPDGRWLAAVGIMDADPLDDVSPGLLLGPADGSAPPIDLTPGLDRPIGSWVDSDLTGWMVDSRTEPAWVANDRIVVVVSDRGRSIPWQVMFDPTTGRPLERTPLVDGDRVVQSLATSTTGVVSWLGTEGTRAMELTTLLVSSGDAAASAPSRPRVRTSMGAAWQRRYPQPLMTLTEAPGSGGPIDVWIASPPEGGDRAIPTVLDVHGGPLGAWAPSPHIEVALLVARGYRVVLPNIRGSTSYGREWIRPQLGDWGGVDADDVHRAVDHVIGLGLADPDRLGVLGLSYGGFMVNWLVGTTDRFRAAVSENGVTNQVSDWANSDTGPEYDRVALLGDPFSPEGIDKLWRQSPLRNVMNVRTPLLLLQAESDLRCPPQDNEQFFIALRHLGRTVEYVLYPDESHAYGNSGRPDRRIDRHTRMLDWFDRYLRDD